MFDLEKALAAWRRMLAYNRAFTADDLDELEQHLRDQVAALTAEGMAEEAAFVQALSEMGSYATAEAEYRKVYWGKRRRRHELGYELSWRMSMLKNYLKVALRSLWRHKGYAFINLAGLAVGIACFVLILLYIRDERSFDRFHADADRIYRLVEARQTPDQGLQHAASTAPAIARALVENVPEIVAAVRVFSLWRANMRHGPNHFYEGDYLFTDPNFFDLFSFEVLQGNPQTVLTEPGSVVLTERAARKYFGDEDPLGQTLATDLIPGSNGGLKVTGIMKDPPPNSHLHFSMLVPSTALTSVEWWEEASRDWQSSWAITYVKLAPGASAEAVTAKLAALTDPQWTAESARARMVALQPLTQIHFDSAHITGERNRNEGRRAYLYIFFAIALLILLIACINYMNLATARSIGRSKEVGLRKVVGAHRGRLIRQFLSESILLTGMAALLAVVLVRVLLPSFNAFTGKAMTFGVDVPFLLVLIGMVLIFGVLTGSYPAFYLSRFQPAQVLRGTLSAGKSASQLRRSLVVLQFALSIVMVVATAVVYSQLQYVQSKELGFNEEQLVIIDINSGVARSRFKAMKAEFSQSPAVRSVSASSRVPGDWKDLRQINVQPEGAAGALRSAYFIAADEAFLDTYEIPLTSGRNFMEGRPADSAAVLLNEAAVRAFGWSDPLGKILRIPASNFEARVAGVVQDFHFQSLHEEIAPLVLGHWNNPVHAIDYFTVRVSTEDLPATIHFLEEAHHRIDQETLFEYNFLDQRLNDFYQREAQVGRLFGTAASLAILIACLGLLGLAAFTAEQRTKEIGIRKVLGASIPNIVFLLLKDFLLLVGIAFVAAVPVSYVAMERWLEDFAYRIEISWPIFLMAGLTALGIALLTVSYQAIRAALADPVKSLRYE